MRAEREARESGALHLTSEPSPVGEVCMESV